MTDSAVPTRRISIFNHQFFGIKAITLNRAIFFFAGMLVVSAAMMNYKVGQEVFVLIDIALGGFLMLEMLNGVFGNG